MGTAQGFGNDVVDDAEAVQVFGGHAQCACRQRLGLSGRHFPENAVMQPSGLMTE